MPCKFGAFAVTYWFLAFNFFPSKTVTQKLHLPIGIPISDYVSVMQKLRFIHKTISYYEKNSSSNLPLGL